MRLVAGVRKGGTRMLAGSDEVKFGNDTANDTKVHPADKKPRKLQAAPVENFISSSSF